MNTEALKLNFNTTKVVRGLSFILTLVYGIHLHALPLEYIKSFVSSIEIHRDGSMDVVETITYVHQQPHGKHGIFRDFPTEYKGPAGTHYSIVFDVKKVMRDGKQEQFLTHSKEGGVSIRIGSADVLLPPGTYTYEIHYQTHRQLNFSHTDYDMLYWNVTGNGWPFLIQQAKAIVRLPEKVSPEKLFARAYTGILGSTAHDATSTFNENGSVSYATAQPLFPHEGLTFQLAWPKGIVIPPTAFQKFMYFFWDNLGIIFTLFALLFSLAWYLFWWLSIKKQEKFLGGPIIPLFSPPQDMSAGEMRYFLDMQYDTREFAAEIVALAVAGYITIDHTPGGWLSSGSYTLTKNKNSYEEPSTLQLTLIEKLFGDAQSIKLDKAQNKSLQRATQALETHYAEKNNHYFVSNASLMTAPLLLSILGFLLLFGGKGAVGLFAALFFIPTIGIHILGHLLLKTYTPEGCKKRHDILGFKMFLAATETERLALIGTPPTKTPQLFEKYLPYAIALGVEKQWTHQFAPFFEKWEKQGQQYHPIWLRGSSFADFSASAFTTHISNSLQSATQSSGSGGYGSGSSGGGRGGGGGGSW